MIVPEIWCGSRYEKVWNFSDFVFLCNVKYRLWWLCKIWIYFSFFGWMKWTY